MKYSPLNEIHKTLGAQFKEMRGWEMPAHYGNPFLEHLDVRKGVGIMDITCRGKIRVSGKDRTKFLQNILSQDVNRLAPHTGAYSTMLDVKGKMLAYMRIYSNENSFLIDTEPGMPEKVAGILTRYLFREDVVLEDVTERYGLITIQGPRSRELLIKATGKEVAEMPECAHIDHAVSNVCCKIVRTSYAGEEGYDIYVPWNDLSSVWVETYSCGREYEIRPFALEALETLRIEAGTPIFSADMHEDTIPLEANLDKAISYDKGCYTGQETIARIKFRGHVNKTLTGFSITGKVVPEKGDRVYKVINGHEQNIGVITSSCFSPTLDRPIALGYLGIEHNKPGEDVYIACGKHKLSAIITMPPFHHTK